MILLKMNLRLNFFKHLRLSALFPIKIIVRDIITRPISKLMSCRDKKTTK